MNFEFGPVWFRSKPEPWLGLGAAASPSRGLLELKEKGKKLGSPGNGEISKFQLTLMNNTPVLIGEGCDFDIPKKNTGVFTVAGIYHYSVSRQ